MTSANTAICNPLDAFTQSIVDALGEAFGVEFELWTFQDAWIRHPHDSAGSGAAPDGSLRAALDATMQQPREPRTHFDVQCDQILVVPLPHDDMLRVAAARFSSASGELLRRLAAATLDNVAYRRRVERLAGENEKLAVQLTDDLEQITFLQEMTENLEVCELSFDLVRMAKTVLPLLNQLIKAECLLLTTTRDELLDGAATLPAHEPFLRFGHTGVDDATCRKLIASFSSDAAVRPVVKNRLQRSAASGEFPGVDSFILVPITKTDRQIGWLIAVNRLRCDESDVLPPDTGLSHLEFGTCEATLLSSAASILATHARNVALFREKEQLLTHMVLALVSTIEAKDDYTCGHSERVALFSKRLGGEMGLDADACERLYLTGLMHDVGKIGVSDATLNKPGKLTKEEFEEIKQHPDTGWSILHEVKHLRYALPGVLYHHERYDGAGYPDGLAGEAIPLDGRILAVCDAYDAMTSDRPYRAGMPQEKAESVLREGAGTQWDPVAIGAFFRILPDILEIRASHRQRPQPKRQHSTIDAQAE